MKKVKKSITMYVVHAICECGGELKPTGVTLRSYPPQYPHICTKCGKTTNLEKIYPIFEQEEVAE